MHNDLPLVCVCIPTYNVAGTVRASLESIMRQTYTNLVVHVSDNASTDDTLKIIESMMDSRVTIHRHTDNVGGEGNYSRCIKYSEGKYTAIFHADDIYEQDIVKEQVAFLESHPKAGAVFTEASLIDEKSNKIGEIRLPKGIQSQGGCYDFESMFKAVMRHSNFFICPSFMVRTQIYQQEIKIWRAEQFGSGSDLDAWLRILQRHPIGHIPEQLMRYRISSSQFSARDRLETGRADFFSVIEYYTEKEQVRDMLTDNDWVNYKWLERRDRVMRAINLFLQDRPQEAGHLLIDLYSRDVLNMALWSKRGLLTMIVGLYVNLLVAMGLHKLGKSSLTLLKNWTHR